MILKSNQLKISCQMIGKLICPNGQIQKIFTTSRYLCINIRVPGQSWYLYIGRGKGNEGVWIYNEAPPPILRHSKDKLLEYTRKYCRNTIVKQVYNLENDIFGLRLLGQGAEHIILFCYRGHILYFIHSHRALESDEYAIFYSPKVQKDKINLSSKESTSIIQHLSKIFPIQVKKDHNLDNSSELIEDSMAKLLIEEKEYIEKLSQKVTNKKIKFYTKKEKKIVEDLSSLSQWELIRSWIDEHNQSDLENINEVKIGNLNIKFKPQFNYYQKLDILYKKIKKLKRGLSIQSKRLQNVLNDKKLFLNKINKKINIDPNIKMAIIRPLWGTQTESKYKKSSDISLTDKNHGIKVFTLENNIKGAIGLSAHGNDYLRSKWSTKKDWWFHLENYTSAHIYLKLDSLTQLTPIDYQIIASMLIKNSNLTITEIPLIYTQVSNLKGVKGVPGKVIYKKTKRMSVQLDPTWEDKVKYH